MTRLPLSKPDIEVTQGALDVLQERQRQQDFGGEGFGDERDDTYRSGELIAAAISYATMACTAAEIQAKGHRLDLAKYAALSSPRTWPVTWGWRWWKPHSPRRDLVRAAALLLAEIDRLDRAGAA